MKISIATVDDAKDILDLQKTAFYQQAVFYNNFKLKPFIETIDEYVQSFSNFTFLKATVDNKLIGSVRAQESNKTCLISRLIVHPDYQKNGIGSNLMVEIEKQFKNHVNRFELFTGEKSQKSISLYRNLGFKIFKRSDEYDVPIVFMEKTCFKENDFYICTVDMRNEKHVSAIQMLVKEYFEWGNKISIEKYGYNFDIEQLFAEFMNELPKYSFPNGLLYLVGYGNGFIGIGGFKAISDKACELKRMYIRETYRGNGLGKKLLVTIIEKAEDFGFIEMLLESARFMINADALYRSQGFKETEIYQGVESPEKYLSIIYCMKKELKPKTGKNLIGKDLEGCEEE